MKLIGSKLEKDTRAEMLRSIEAHKDSNSLLHIALQRGNIPITNLIVLDWIPEQGEDIFLVLIEGSYLVRVEIDRYDQTKQPIIDRIELKEYQVGLSKTNQVRLMIAQELSENK